MKRRKSLISIIALLLVMAMLAAGCGSSGGKKAAGEAAEKVDPTEAAKEAVTACMEKLKAGDIAGAADYFTNEAKEDDFFTTTLFAKNELTDSVLESTGLTKDMVKEELQASIDKFTNTFNNKMIMDYRINEVTANEEDGTAEVEVEYGFDLHVFDNINPEEFFEGDAVNKYVEEHKDELMAIEDETKQMAALLNGIMPMFIDKMTEILESSEGGKETWKLSLELVDGSWKIGKMLSE